MEEAEAGGAEEMVGESIQTVSRHWGALILFEFFHLYIPNRKEKNKSISLLLNSISFNSKEMANDLANDQGGNTHST